MGAIGYLMGSFSLWFLPAAFLAYGRSQSRRWATNTGTFLVALLAAAAFGRGVNVGDMLGGALVAATLAFKPKADRQGK